MSRSQLPLIQQHCYLRCTEKDSLGQFNSFVICLIKSQSFLVIYSVIHKRVSTPPRDLTTWITEAIDHSSNSTMAFTKKFTSRIFCKCKCHCWVWRMIDSLYYSSQKIPERFENSFVNYKIKYQKLCYSLRRIWTQSLYIYIVCAQRGTKWI